MTPLRIAVTGAAGFLGRAVLASAAKAGHHPVAILRRPPAENMPFECRVAGDLAAPLDWRPLLAGIDVVVNCAAQVRGGAQPAADAVGYRAINVGMPLRLAEAARGAGVKRLIQLSSLAAIGTTTRPGEVWDDRSAAHPTSAYGRSKLEADEALAALSDVAMPIVSLRPPTLYGPGVSGPFAALMKAARLGLPLPMGAVRNSRSLAFVDNVADAVIAASTSSIAGAYVVADHPPISTADLYRRLLAAFDHGDRVWRCPEFLVRAAAAPLGARGQSVIGDAACDGSRFCAAVGWQPATDLHEAIARTVAAYR